jgi:hypothetical protein
MGIVCIYEPSKKLVLNFDQDTSKNCFSVLKLMSRGCVVRYSAWYYVLCIRKCLDKFITVFEQINDGRRSRSTLQYLYYNISAESNKLLLTRTLNHIATWYRKIFRLDISYVIYYDLIANSCKNAIPSMITCSSDTVL